MKVPEGSCKTAAYDPCKFLSAARRIGSEQISKILITFHVNTSAIRTAQLRTSAFMQRQTEGVRGSPIYWERAEAGKEATTGLSQSGHKAR